MKINCHVDPNLEEEHGELWIKKMTPKINDFLQIMTSNDDVLWCHYESQIIPVEYQDIFSLEVTSRETNIFTENQLFSYNDHLANMKATLPSYFIEASRSAIFNYNYY